jgi:hypothetical protein
MDMDKMDTRTAVQRRNSKKETTVEPNSAWNQLIIGIYSLKPVVSEDLPVDTSSL